MLDLINVFISNLNSNVTGVMPRTMLKCNGLLQQDNAKDYVIATGRTESVRHFAEIMLLILVGVMDKTLLCIGKAKG